MEDVIKKIRMYSSTHRRYKALCDKQKLKLNEATEIIMRYIEKNDVDIRSLEDGSNVPLPQLINNVNENVIKSSNTYVSFQRTFENQNSFLQNAMILMIYNTLQIDDDKKKKFKSQLLFDLIKLKIAIHPKQELIKSMGGIDVFGSKYLRDQIDFEQKNIQNKEIFDIIITADSLVEMAIKNYK